MEIPEIQVQQVEVPVVRRLEPPVVLTPSIRSLQKPVVQVPTAELPYYEPIDVPTTEQWKQIVEGQNSQKEKEETQEEKSRQLPPAAPIVPPAVQVPQETTVVAPPPTNLGVPVIEVPLIGEVPVPPKEQVILAGTTATASVAAALVGKSLVEWMVGKMKPIVQQIYVQAKKRLHRDLTPYELQVDFAAQLDLKKKVLKTFQKELKQQKKEQYLHWSQQQHQHISSHKETGDENVSQPSLLRRILRGGRVRNQDVPYQSPPSGD
jgi:hypothetical protein